MLTKNLEYGLAGALALYIVFMTRPAPASVVQALSSPVVQVAALAAVIYVGATQSLVVAVVLALAVVMSTPAREYFEPKKPKKEDKPEPKPAMPSAMKEKEKEKEKEVKSDEPAAAGHSVGKETFATAEFAPF